MVKTGAGVQKRRLRTPLDSGIYPLVNLGLGFTIFCNSKSFVYSPSDTERAVTAKLKRNNAIYCVDVFTLIMSLVHLYLANQHVD